MKRKNYILLVLMLMVLILSGCSNAEAKAGNEEEKSSIVEKLVGTWEGPTSAWIIEEDKILEAKVNGDREIVEEPKEIKDAGFYYGSDGKLYLYINRYYEAVYRDLYEVLIPEDNENINSLVLIRIENSDNGQDVRFIERLE